MAGRSRIPPYRPLDGSTPAVPGGGYIDVDASAGAFGPSPLLQFGLQTAEGVAGIAGVVAQVFALDDEAVVKDADLRLGQAEQTLLFDPQNGYLNTQGQTALTHAPAVLKAYGQAQQREVAALANDEQRRMLENLAQRRLTTFGEQVERHGEAERLRWHDQAGDQRIAQMQADAGFYWSDDALLRRALGTTRAEVRDKAERHGWDLPLTEAALGQQTSRTLVAAIEAAVERDPERARSLRRRYDKHIDEHGRAGLDALLAEAQTRERGRQASAEILNSRPPDGRTPTPQWQIQQAEAIAEPAVRAAVRRSLQSAAAAAEARARTLAEHVLARVLKDGLTDPSQIPVREWVALDAERRQAIETRLDHNARGTEPAANPALVGQLAAEMTQVPHAFTRRDLVPAVAHLPLPQWQRFRDWQAGIRRNDRTAEEELYAIKRGLQLAQKMLPEAEPASDNDNSAPSAPALDAPFRAALVEEIDTAHRLTDKSPDDAALREMVQRRLPDASLHNIGMMPMDPQLARRLAALPEQALDALFSLFLLMLMNSIMLQSRVDRMTRTAPQPPSILPTEEPDEKPSAPSSDPAEPPSTKPSSTPPPPTPPVPPPPGSASGQQPTPSQPPPPPAQPPSITPALPRSASVTFTRDQLQHSFRRATQFGVQGTQNNQTLSTFEKVLRAHIDAPGTVTKVGSFRGLPAIHYVDPVTRLNVMVDAAGKFWSAWQLSPAQLANVIARGAL